MNPPPGIEALPNNQWVVAGDTHLGNWAKQHGNVITDPMLFQWLKPHLEGVKTVWDVGANIGDHACQYFDWGMQVVAVEPNPLAFICLRHNCPGALSLSFAASDEKGTLRLELLDNVGASRITEHGVVEVEARALDDLLKNLPAPEFIKLDIEGFEVFALQGMVETLKRHKPILFIEINHGALAANGHSSEDIVRLLNSCGYTNMRTYPEGVSWNEAQFDILCLP